MSAISNWIRKAKQRLLNPSRSRPIESSQDRTYSPPSAALAPTRIHKQNAISSSVRKPYFLQIGFDLGTAFSKCVIRDVASDTSWVYIPPKAFDPNLPFVIPSKLRLDHGLLFPVEKTEDHYSAGHLSMFKLALHQTIKGVTDGSLIREFEELRSHYRLDASLDAILESFTAVYLAFAFSDIQAHLDQKYPDFGRIPKDSLFVNLAIPAAAADHVEIRNSFDRALNLGWKLRKEICLPEGIPLKEVLRQTIADFANVKGAHQRCE